MNKYEKSLERIKKNVFPSDNWTEEDFKHYHTVIEAIELAVKQNEGEWKQQMRPNDDFIVCSACEAWFNLIDNCTEKFKFCPNCGARMEGV